MFKGKIKLRIRFQKKIFIFFLKFKGFKIILLSLEKVRVYMGEKVNKYFMYENYVLKRIQMYVVVRWVSWSGLDKKFY